MEWVASTLHTTSEHGVSLMRTPRLAVVDWTDDPLRFKWSRPFRRKTKSGFCACAITFQTQSTFPAHSITRRFPNFCTYYTSPYPSHISNYYNFFPKFYDILYYVNIICTTCNLLWVLKTCPDNGQLAETFRQYKKIKYIVVFTIKPTRCINLSNLFLE